MYLSISIRPSIPALSATLAFSHPNPILHPSIFSKRVEDVGGEGISYTADGGGMSQPDLPPFSPPLPFPQSPPSHIPSLLYLYRFHPPLSLPSCTVFSLLFPSFPFSPLVSSPFSLSLCLYLNLSLHSLQSSHNSPSLYLNSLSLPPSLPPSLPLCDPP